MTDESNNTQDRTFYPLGYNMNMNNHIGLSSNTSFCVTKPKLPYLKSHRKNVKKSNQQLLERIASTSVKPSEYTILNPKKNKPENFGDMINV